MIDIHNHCLFSHDSNEDSENSVKTAISKGGIVFGISDHVQCFSYLSFEKTCNQVGQIVESLSSLKEKYKDKIKFVFGYEADYSSDSEEKYLYLENHYKVDYVINSLHCVKNVPFFIKDFMVGKDSHQVASDYLDDIIESLKVKYDYQVLGHLGQIGKVFITGNKNIEYSEFPNKFDEILKYLIEHNKALEVNTNFDGVNVFPHVSVIKRYYELGGRIVTLAGDAHVAECVYKYSNVGIKTLKEIGFKAISFYENKIRKEVNI